MEVLLRYEEWSAPQEKFIQENLSRINVDGYTSQQFRSGLREIHERSLQEYDPYAEIREVMDKVSPAYLDATDEQRLQIRTLVADLNDLCMLVRGYADTMSAEIKSSQDTNKLRYGLAAISIENCRTDSRDTMTSLADLFVGAEEAGIDPKPCFLAVAELSCREVPTGGNTPVAEMLRDFHTYVVVKERRHNGVPYRQTKDAE